MLEINNVNKFFGGLKAVHNASMKVEMGSITGLIGPNGAGKTTLFNTIAGLYDPDEGNIILNNEDISFLKPHELFAKGVLRTFQIAHEFSTLTVLENLMMVPPNQFGEKLSYALLSNSKPLSTFPVLTKTSPYPDSTLGSFGTILNAFFP